MLSIWIIYGNIYDIKYIWLVVDFQPLLKKYVCESQLGWYYYSQLNGKIMFQSTNQVYIYIYIGLHTEEGRGIQHHLACLKTYKWDKLINHNFQPAQDFFYPPYHISDTCVFKYIKVPCRMILLIGSVARGILVERTGLLWNSCVSRLDVRRGTLFSTSEPKKNRWNCNPPNISSLRV